LFAHTQADTKFAAAELTSQSGVSSPTINTLAAKSRKDSIVSLIEVRDTVDAVRLQFDIYNTKFSIGGAVDSAITALFKDPSGTATIKIESTVNASDKDAVVHAKVFGTGDPKAVYESPSGSSWQVGVDNSDSDKFKIAQSSDQSWTNTLITVDAGQDLFKVGTDWIQGSATTTNLRFITHSIANDGTAQLLDITKPHAIAFIIDPEDGAIAIYTVHKNGNSVNEIADAAGIFSPTSGTASSVNIYYSAGNTRYEIENKRGGTRSFYIFYFAGE
jgi:hypothetical protein